MKANEDIMWIVEYDRKILTVIYNNYWQLYII
jgi:hypothetical protein